MKSLIILTLLLPLLVACSWFEKNANPPLEGERTAVLPQADQLKSESASTPTLDAAQDVANWPAQNQNIFQTGAHANITPKFEKIWDRSIGEGKSDRKEITTRPVAADGKIFAMDNRGNLTAMDAKSGKLLWRVRSRAESNSALAGGLTVDNGVLYVTNGLSQILAVSAANGGKIWSANLDAPARTAPTVADGKVFVVTRGGQSFCLDAQSGKILWQHKGLLESAAILSGAAPAADGEMVMIPYASGEVLAMAAGNGSVLWGESLASGRAENNLATLHDLRAPPMILDDIIIAANYASNITAMERRSGDRVWAHNFGALQPMTTSGDTVFLITTNSQLVAINRKSGELFWSVPLQSEEREAGEPQEYWYGPLLLNGQLFVLSANGMGELRDAMTGAVTAAHDDLAEPAENPITANGMIYWTTASGEVVAYQ
ncbi:MAG TPA: PQQ-binding-like beta-propeller repeat protein [Alphaproteobacteria bacterium]|nr:hypothetical protein [Rhodospirillaceae bacterium]HRJ12282.1 PQQ-binding-like beta-propeller repeat protein [Alphaproteobacteria bacterium]